MSLGPGSLSRWLSAPIRLSSTTKGLTRNRLPMGFLQRVACDLHEVCWVQEDWKDEYSRSRQVRLLEVRMHSGNQGEILQ